jgi:hypothetical protein
MDFTQIDRSAFSVGSFNDEPDDLAFWLGKTPGERLAGIEFLRQQFYGYREGELKMEKFFEVVEFKPSNKYYP